MTTIKFKNVEPSHEVERNFDLKYERIKAVYKGRIDACTCGCEGDFHYTKHYAEYKSKVENNHLLLPLANDGEVEFLLQDALVYSDTARFFVQMSGGYNIKVPTHTEWKDAEGGYVQMGYIVDLHWKDIKLDGTKINL